MTLWEIDIHPAAGQTDVAGKSLSAEARDLGLDPHLTIAAAHGFILQGELSREQVSRAAELLLADAITESTTIAQMGSPELSAARAWFDSIGACPAQAGRDGSGCPEHHPGPAGHGTAGRAVDHVAQVLAERSRAARACSDCAKNCFPMTRSNACSPDHCNLQQLDVGSRLSIRIDACPHSRAG